MSREFIITEIRRFKVNSDSLERAIKSRESGDGVAIPEPVIRYGFYSTNLIPEDSWPTWANDLKEVSTTDDKGIGDVVARTIGPENSEPFKAWMKKTFNKSCTGGCVARLNALYPLERKP